MSSPKIIPAKLSFLAIYNPSLGCTDDTFREQVVFYHSRTSHKRQKGRQHAEAQNDADNGAQLEENEKLRQIGLAQGMIGFAKGFADEQAVDHVETEKSRIVMREIEEGWWMLAVLLSLSWH